MKTALIYDELTPRGEGSWVEAEYESPETIAALMDAIGRNCDEAVACPLGPDLMERLRSDEPDLAFNIAEGREGASRESLVPALLDFMGIPYTGSDGVALGVSLNKALTKRIARAAGVPTPPFRLLRSAREAEEAARELDYPVLVKPNFGGSSVGVSPENVVAEPAGLAAVVERELRLYEQPCLAEQYIRGEDVTVGLLGNGGPEVLPAGKVVAPGGMYSELVKKLHEREVVCPCALPQDLERKLIEWSVALFRGIGARDFARVDFMLDAGGRAWFLEINPLPGLSPYYGVYPALARAAGYGHSELIGRIMSLAQNRCAERERMRRRLARAAIMQCPHC
jgi:D-alanine-D-alanine ligase